MSATTRVVALAILTGISACADAPVESAPGVAEVGRLHDTVFARRILMAGIAFNMEEITAMLDTPGDLDLAGAREHAGEISTMLLAFGHLFPPGTDTRSRAAEEADAARVSFARSKVWQTFDDFYGRSQAASKVAFDASMAARTAQFRRLAVDLQQQCDACHAEYRRY